MVRFAAGRFAPVTSLPMSVILSRRFTSLASIATAFVMGALATGHADAEDLLGLYVGGAVGQSQVQANVPTVGDFKENHSAFKVIAGIRPISLIGAEISYVDFGHPSGNINAVSSSVSQKGADLFAVLYLPVPVVDVFLKAGLARLQSTVNSVNVGVGTCTTTDPNCALFRLDRTDTSFAAGAGAQFKLGSWAVRGEYEHFDAAGANPSLVSVGFAWTFL
jgi:opacity protein-like surface antigen